MNRWILTPMLGAACALTFATSAAADYTGIEWAELDQGQPAGIFVYAFYVSFDNPADRLLGVIGDADNPLHIWTDLRGGFHQTPAVMLGSDLAPPATFTAIFPELLYDSFFTIGLGAGYEGEDTTGLTPGWFDLVSPGFNADGTIGPAAEGWFNGNPDNMQGAPDGDGRVQIAQLSFNGFPFINGESLVIGWNDADGNTHQTPDNFFFPPAPGTLALFALAGLAGRRRRSA